QLLTSEEVLRNACALYENDSRFIVAYLSKTTETTYRVSV
ncbi:unnamed protein product, partial [marine sediment metagenome]